MAISHCREDEFHARFRDDLSSSVHHAVILSPFLSQNRASYYYSALQVLQARGVSVDVYARPRHEQPDTLLNHYDSVKRRLTNSGVAFHERPGMHEKVGVLDNNILWHGSLNILSHNDSRESMLRFESSELVEEVLIDLELQPVRKAAQETEQLVETEQRAATSPNCPICHDDMKLYPDISLWICQNSPSCKGLLPAQPPEMSHRDSRLDYLPMMCPLSGDPLQVSHGTFTRIVCSSHDCDFSLEPRISAGILRVIRRASAS